jgi:nicotinate-nucleotide pyrophosphorylase (carboxylating)
MSSSNSSTSANANANLQHLLPKAQIQATVRGWLDDDMPGFDVGGFVVGDTIREAQLLLKSPGIFAGKPFCQAVFDELGCTIRWSAEYQEGDDISHASGTATVCLAVVAGPVHRLLQGERTALNALSRCSGVATISHMAVTRARSLGWNGHVAGTRKTTPGFRVVEKYGLLVGGAATHRLDLSQMVMLKDNHVWATGSITQAVVKAKAAAGFSQKIEVECQSLEEAIEAATAGAVLCVTCLSFSHY